MAFLKDTNDGTGRGSRGHGVSAKRPVTVKGNTPSAKARGIWITATQHDSTPQDQHRFRAAADALLLELVRQRLGRKGS